MCYAGCLIRTVAQVQGVVSLSFCEAELHALQYMCQESLGLTLLLERVLSSLDGATVTLTSQAHVGDWKEDEAASEWEGARLVTDLISDSQAAIDLLNGQDVPRRSRHVEIRLQWMRSKMASGEVRLEWIRGTLNPADIFTKNVTAALLNLRRSRLGFVTVRDSPAQSLFELSLQRGRIDVRQEAHVALLEVCCSVGSELAQECRRQNIPYAGVVQSMQERRVFNQACDVVRKWRACGRWVHIHLSTLARQDPR